MQVYTRNRTKKHPQIMRNYLEAIAYDNRFPLIIVYEIFTDQRYFEDFLEFHKNLFLHDVLWAIFEEDNVYLF